MNRLGLRILFAPDVDLDDNTYDTLTKWLKNDGKFGHHLFYMPRSGLDPKGFPHINELLADCGMHPKKIGREALPNLSP